MTQLLKNISGQSVSILLSADVVTTIAPGAFVNSDVVVCDDNLVQEYIDKHILTRFVQKSSIVIIIPPDDILPPPEIQI